MSSHNTRAHKHRGFTLIEVMMVVVIVAILAAFALPSFLNYSREARRAEGRALLLDIAAQQERFFYRNARYTTTLSTLGAAGALSENGFYQLTAPMTADAISFSLTAVAQNDQTNDVCGNFTLDSTANASHSAGPAGECDW